MKNIMPTISIAVFEELLNDPARIANAYLDKKSVFEWVDPRLIVPKESNRPHKNVEGSADLSDEDLDILVDYYRECIGQRESLEVLNGEEEYISPILHLDTMLFLAVKFGREINYTDFRREVMNEAEFSIALDHTESAIKDLNDGLLKKGLKEFIHFFFCHIYVSPELETLPELQKFRNSKSNITRLNNISLL